MRHTSLRGWSPWLASLVCASCLSACGTADDEGDGTRTSTAGSVGLGSSSSTTASGGNATTRTTGGVGAAGSRTDAGAAGANAWVLGNAATDGGAWVASAMDSAGNAGQPVESSFPLVEQGGASNPSSGGSGTSMGGSGISIGGTEVSAGASIGFPGGTGHGGGVGNVTLGGNMTTGAAGATATTAWTTTLMLAAGAANTGGSGGGTLANSGGTAGGLATNIIGSGGIGTGGVSPGGGSSAAGASMNIAGSSSITTAASSLPNPIHVIVGATRDGADGSLTHPFADIGSAVSAIRATASSGPVWDGTIVVHRGRYELATTVELPPTADVELQSGVTLALGSNANFHANRSVKVVGTETEPVLFTWLTEGKHWGSFTLFVAGSLDNEFTWAIFEHGGEVTYKGISVRGALSLENAGGRISHCTFQNNEGDDGLSLGSSHTMVDHSSFLNNAGDGIDVDGPGGQEISFCYFDGNGNDGLDTGEGADLWAHDNMMVNSGDTGVEVGEASTPIIDHNIMAGNAMGIGIKDDADPLVFNNTVYNNQFGITAYHFKAAFGTGKGTIYNTIVWGSKVADVALVNDAPTKISYSCIQSGKYLDSTNKNGRGNVAPLAGEGLLSKGAGCEDPLFVNAAALDFHLQSAAGHFVTADGSWLNDAQTSPCIDAGNPTSPVGLESMPNGGRIDLGVYGGTAQASHSP